MDKPEIPDVFDHAAASLKYSKPIVPTKRRSRFRWWVFMGIMAMLISYLVGRYH